MPHDYQYWQRQRRTTSAYWRFFYNPPQLGDIATSGRGRITDFARTAQRTANAAYWLRRTVDVEFAPPAEPLPEELRNSIIPDRAPGPQRTANDHYWHPNQPQIADEIIGMRISELPDRAPGAKRTANEQYWHANQPQIGDEVAGMPVWNIPDRALGPARSVPSVYWRDNQPQIGDEVIGMPVWNIPDIARGPQRTANVSYLLNLSPQIGDEVEGMRIRELPDIARGATRTANTAYLVNASFVIDDAVIELEEFRKLAITDFARAAMRAPNTEYLIRQTPQINDEVAGMPVWNIPDKALGARRAADYLINLKPAIADEVVGMRIKEITDFARGPQRTANTAYWYDNTQAAIIETAAQYSPEVRQSITERADGFRRAANPSYWAANWPLPADVILSGGRGYFTIFAKGARRADQTAYDQPKRSVIIDDVVVPDFEEIRRRLLPECAPGKQRAANSAYWNWTIFRDPDGTLFVSLESFNSPMRAAPTAYWQNGVFVGPDFILGEEVLRRIVLPERIEAKGRANTIYLINSRFAEDIVGFNSEVRQAITEMAPGPRWAANTAYWAWTGQGTVIIDDVAAVGRRPKYFVHSTHRTHGHRA